jgi:kynurenine 3-monooxygenase
MAARGIRGLKHAGVFDLVEPLLVPMKGRCVHDLDGTTQLHLYGQRENEKIYSVSRSALNKILVDAAETEYKVQIRFGQEAVTYYPEEATLRVRDLDTGSDYDVRAKPLIASDGAGSVVRRAFADTDIIGVTGYR